MVAVAMAVSEGWCSTDLLLVSTSGDLDIRIFGDVGSNAT
jgi:hypothetical protein